MTRLPGLCLRCQTPVREILATFKDGSGPLAGTPSRVGDLLEHGTRVRFLTASGTYVDLEFCVDCANALTPADFPAIWEAVLEYEDAVGRHRGPHAADGVTLLPKPENQRKLWLAKLSSTFLLGRAAAFVDTPDGARRLDARVQV